MNHHLFTATLLFYVFEEELTRSISTKVITSKIINYKVISEIRSESAKRRKCKKRVLWSEFENELSDKKLRRYFRMPRNCFRKLCYDIKSNISNKEFKSEKYTEKLAKREVGTEWDYKLYMSK